MKKKVYILPKHKAEKVSDPVLRFYIDEDERILGDLIEESEKSIKITKTYKIGKQCKN